ncbi:esterase/lipase [Mycolicibacterium phlei]|uniref:Uncharacterized protein n=1 Tax=Mycolicibacterium phlei DSM 43239 = CCUG 21000 TaxID=1226750 RepID=A0A5N5UQP6_MYCPH|nr:hypothetical protein [Mycolicibacterium phlei]VEG08198.1 esterase/lipase [Mycobacteroides chelonae]AMO60077.1 hypothetical protein MPHLCCUG_01251 [Mycolicibacterium phlei]KAB7751883.1 hypothetical protein MPHL21000_23485 [Mycolicibacterium phlei DSM 43239 = CCUG 21000]KXW60471.1 hypothetical protein MPHL43239_25205 [Mycolicibacterium phlei DSM 43239 = CCUG 21000]KXW66599.1 hypothetical protein MPHL43072_05655 [Mycolicibacterium phlei DSM 43072]
MTDEVEDIEIDDEELDNAIDEEIDDEIEKESLSDGSGQAIPQIVSGENETEEVTEEVTEEIEEKASDFSEPVEPVEPAPEPEPEPAPVAARAAVQTNGMQTTVEAAGVPATPARPTLINIVGTLVWSVADFVINLIVGPPVVVPGSGVSAGRSTVKIDCGDGYRVQTDWYFPTEGQPDKLIYFQHGFLSPAATYNVTLTELARRNNAIVVAPSITSNYFACDSCSLTADQMHAAVAELFAGDRTALQESAAAAGFEGTLPTQFVLAGQSAGSILAAGTAGYYYEKAADDRKADLVGVLLYDGSAANGALARALDKLPADLPVLQIAGVPAVVNNGGEANAVLAEKRPGQFTGLQLVNGAHSDAFRSSIYGGLVQAFVGLVFGQSTPENVEAVQVLPQGWLTDMYAGRVFDENTRTGIYGPVGAPGTSIVDIPTSAGPARGYVLPGPASSLSPIERVFATLLHSINADDYAVCAADPAACNA